jgi:hypothetical protein
MRSKGDSCPSKKTISLSLVLAVEENIVDVRAERAGTMLTFVVPHSSRFNGRPRFEPKLPLSASG